MKVLILATGQDTGGQGIRIAEAFAKYEPTWTVDSRHAVNPLGYPGGVDLQPRDRINEWRRLYDAADVVHLRDKLTGYDSYDRGQHKPIVLHHHGSQFRSNHGSVSHRARKIGATQIASTIDLTLLEPGIEWLPSPYDLDDLAAIRQSNYEPTDRIRIAHFPTSKGVKSTDAFLAAIANLAKKYPLTAVGNLLNGRIRPQKWPVVMAQKATADIYFDQVTLGYGNNAVEAWGMGMPVVAGVVDPRVRAAMVERFGTLPFVEATEDSIEPVLERLIQSEQMRTEYAALGMAHVRRFHDSVRVVEQLTRIYGAATPTHAVQPYASPSWLARQRVPA